jgi:DNA-binding NarL/FixJ family response regulator
VKNRPSKKLTVAIVGDQPMLRERLGRVIRKADDMAVRGEAGNIRDGFALLKKLRPNIAIIDFALKGSNGLELLKDLHAHGIDVPVIVLSMHDEPLYAERVLRAGARGYITRNEASANMVVAIRQVLKGGVYLNPHFVSEIMTKLMGDRPRGTAPIDRLADRELEVFELIGRGLTTREIGSELRLGLTTVGTYRARIKGKLKLENAARLRLEASRWIQQRR